MKITNTKKLPSFLVKAAEFWAQHHDSQAEYSVTELLDAPRRVALMSQHADQLTEDVSDRMWSLLGSSVHKVIEAALEADDDDTLISEHRMFAEIDGIRISGQCDVYDSSSNQLYDLKTASVWEIINGVREEREQQLNCYAYLGRREGWKVDGIAAVFILRDWSKNKALEHDYPADQAFVYPLKMWDDAVTEQFLRDRIRVHEDAKVKLPYCTPEEQWRREDKFAVRVSSAKKALRVKDSMAEAHQWMAEQGKGEFVEVRPGKAVRCEDYCSVRDYCTQYGAMTLSQQSRNEAS